MGDSMHLALNNNTAAEIGGSTPITLYLNYETDRLKTFDSWTNKGVDKCELAKYGFFYKGPRDAVECAYCQVIIAGWDYGDSPLREHIQWSPSCSFLLHKAPINVAIEKNFKSMLPSPKYFTPIIYNADDPIGQEDDRPIEKIKLYGKAAMRHPAYQLKVERLNSYQTWPRALKQTPTDLSEAGLFYLRVGDQVKCFSCGGALRDWEEDDEPWIEHAKNFEHCDYLKECKGEQFIKDVNTSNDVSMADIPKVEDVGMDDELTSINKCNICLVNDLNIIFLPCGHIYTCGRCAFEFTHCPVCRIRINRFEKCHFANASLA